MCVCVCVCEIERVEKAISEHIYTRLIYTILELVNDFDMLMTN